MPSKSHRKKHALKFWKSLSVLCCPTRGNSLNSKGKHSQKHPPGPCGDRLLLGCARKESPPQRVTPNSSWMYLSVQPGAFSAHQDTSCALSVFLVIPGSCREISGLFIHRQDRDNWSCPFWALSLPGQAKLSSSDLCSQMLGSAGSSEHFPGSNPLLPPFLEPSVLPCPSHPSKPRTERNGCLLAALRSCFHCRTHQHESLEKMESKKKTKNKHGFPKPISSTRVVLEAALCDRQLCQGC